ncbi:MAG TPA: sugar phosphate isomerase/epimerase family protein [Terriglobales bacterium]|nr:sugar phosphate isomerase/epimerase family protein [Terriglobales bacterium]
MAVRLFLCALAALTAAAGLIDPRDAASGRAAVRLGVCDWTIEKTGDPAALDLAARLGLDGVQVSLVPKGDSLALAEPELERAYLRAAERSGVAIASFALGELNNVPLKSDPRAERWLAKAIEVARAMNVGVVLVPFFGKGELRHDAPGQDAVVAALRRLAPAAEKAGVVLALESYLSAAENLAILGKVGSAAVRIYYDVGNSQSVGHPVAEEIRRLGDRIVEIHAKDTKGLYGQGSMDFVSVRGAMAETGFHGWLVIEGTEMPLGVERSVRHDAGYLRSVFAETR